MTLGANIYKIEKKLTSKTQYVFLRSLFFEFLYFHLIGVFIYNLVHHVNTVLSFALLHTLS